jgi:hypothetical protein
MFNRSLGTAAVLAGLLAAAAPAHAGTSVGNPGKGSAVIESIGTKYTMLTPSRVGGSKNEVSIESNEPQRFLPEVNDEVLVQ